MADSPIALDRDQLARAVSAGAVRSLRPQFGNWRLLRVNEDEPETP